jgi:hypothetical protein
MFDETTSQNKENNGSVESKNAEQLTRHFHLDAETSLGSDLLSPSISASVILTQHKNYGDDMKNGFIKLSREALELALTYPLAAWLLQVIALRAKREETRFNQHLDFCECEFNCCEFEDLPHERSLTRQNVRTILNFLKALSFLTTRSTGRFLYIKLTDKSIYDINEEQSQPLNQPRLNRKLTASQPQAQVHHNNIRSKEEYLSNDKYIVSSEIGFASPELTSDNLYNGSENILEANKNSHSEQSEELKTKKSNKNQTKYSEDSFEYRISKRMFVMAKKLFPKKKEPNWQTWCKHVNDMQKIDEISEEEILKLLDWLENDDFWRRNVRCTEKLREKFEDLWSRMLPPDKKQKESLKDVVSKRFTNGKFYNGAECFIDDYGIAFQRGMTHVSVKFIEKGFNDQLENTLRRFGICA